MLSGGRIVALIMTWHFFFFLPCFVIKIILLRKLGQKQKTSIYTSKFHIPVNILLSFLESCCFPSFPTEVGYNFWSAFFVFFFKLLREILKYI